MANALIYGANGYTAQLIARLASQYGIRPILAGRDRDAVMRVARTHGLTYRIFSLDDVGLDDVAVVLNCAGPFIHTADALARACLRSRVHYIDITGEIEVFEQLHARDAEARAAGVMLLPGAGFDVVPSDCLAAHLKEKLPGAVNLVLAIAGGGRLARGTATTMVTHAGRGGMIRRNGQLTRVKLGAESRVVDFGFGPRTAISIPWGDIATAYYSTGIPNIAVFSVPPRGFRPVIALAQRLNWILRSRLVQRALIHRIRAGPPGPDEAELRSGKSYVWAEVTDDQGNSAVARCTGPNGYLLTAHTALLILKRVLSGDLRSGFQTPSMVWGPDLILAVPSVYREAGPFIASPPAL